TPRKSQEKFPAQCPLATAGPTTNRQSPAPRFRDAPDPLHIGRSTLRPSQVGWHPEFQPPSDSAQHSLAVAEPLLLRPSADIPSAPAEQIPQLEPYPPNVRPGTIRNRSLRGRRGCIGYKVAFRMCGRRPPQQFRCEWRSSYEPPVRGHRHYRQFLERWTLRSAGQNEMIIRLAVVALLLLLGLLCCVVLVVLLF